MRRGRRPEKRTSLIQFTSAVAAFLFCILGTPFAGNVFNSAAHAQVLKAKWVEKAERRIKAIRTGAVRVIVLGHDGDPVENCEVHIQMKRHAFPFGVSIGAKPFTRSPVASKHHQAPVWRCFNAVSLDRVGKWTATQPGKDRWDFSGIEHALAWSEQRGMIARWGGVVSADRGRMPKWTGKLRAAGLTQAIEQHTKHVIQKYGRRVDQFDLMTNTLDHKTMQKQLGVAFIRKLYQAADSQVPGLPEPGRLGRACAQFSDAFHGERLQNALKQVTYLKESFVPIQAVAINMRLNGSIVEASISRSLDWLGGTGLPVVLTGLEVGGSSPTGAAINLETALRAMFSNPNVHGLWFAGCFADELNNPDAALLDSAGETTLAGAVFDNLVRKHWWTDVKEKTDPLGNVRTRVFAGLHQLTAILPNGDVAKAQVFIYPGKQEKLIVMQPVKVEAGIAKGNQQDKNATATKNNDGDQTSKKTSEQTRGRSRATPIIDPFR